MYTQRVACALPVLPRPQEKERLAKQQAGEEGEDGQGQGEGEKKPAGKKAKGPQYAGRKGGGGVGQCVGQWVLEKKPSGKKFKGPQYAGGKRGWGSESNGKVMGSGAQVMLI